MAVSFFKQRNVRENQLRKNQQPSGGSGQNSFSTSTTAGFSQSMKDLTRPKPGFSPEPVKAQHKSGSPVFVNVNNVQKNTSFTSRSLETLHRPQSAESPSLLPAIDTGSRQIYQTPNQFVQNVVASSSNPLLANQSCSNQGSQVMTSQQGYSGTSSFLGSGTPQLTAALTPVGGNSAPKSYQTATTLLQHQYSIPPLLYLNNLLTVAKLDELRRNSTTSTTSLNLLYPLKTTTNNPSNSTGATGATAMGSTVPATSTGVIGGGGVGSGGFGAIHNTLLGVGLTSLNGQQQLPHSSGSSTQNLIHSDLTPRREDFDAQRKPTPSLQLPPISKSSFSCKECMFSATHQSKLDLHIMTHHTGPTRQPDHQPIAIERGDKYFNQSGDGSGGHFDEHNATFDSNTNNDSSGSFNASSNPNSSGQGSLKPFKCPDCNYSTIYENCLKSHQARHSSEFEEILQSTLLTEMRFENGYKCTICNNYSTAYKKCLASHLLKHKKGGSGPVGPIQKLTRPRISSNKSTNSRSSATGASDPFRRPASGSSMIYSDDDQCSSLLEATNRDLTIDEEGEIGEFDDVKEENDDEEEYDGPCSKRQNMRSSQDYMMDIDEHRHVVTSTPEVGVRQSVNACPYCETIFKNDKVFTVHMSFHSDDNPFTCKSCGTPCNDSYEFELHLIQSQHKIDIH